MKKKLKKLIPLMALLCIAIYFNAKAQYLRAYTSKAIGLGTATKDDSTWYFSPSVAMNIFYRNNNNQQSSVGAIPGIGYGLRFAPSKNKNHPLLSLDLFAQGSILNSNNQYFSFSLLPVLTIYNWLSVGYGGDEEFGVKPGVPDKKIGSVFTIGVSKSL